MVNGKVTSYSKDTAILPVKKISGDPIKILLVDDSNSIRETLKYHLDIQSDFVIVGSVNNARTALEQIKTLNPDVILMDIEMPGIDGIKATMAIAQQFEQTKTIVLSSHNKEDYVNRVLEAGAKGYLLKTIPIEELINSIRFVHKGYLQFSPELWKQLNSGKIVATTTQIATPKDSDIVPASSIELQPYDWSSQTKELIDTLPKRWTRGLFYFLTIFVTIALPWAMLSKVDETGTARGRLEPSNKTFILDSPVAGTVEAINVKEGDSVEQGQSLLELESDIVSAELRQLQNQLTGEKDRLAQLELLKKQLLSTVNAQEQEIQAQKLEKQTQVVQAQQQLQFYQTSYSSQEEEKLAQVNQAQQNVVYSQTAFNSAQKALNKAQKEITRYRQALQQGVIAEVQVVEQENIIAEKQQAFDRARSELQQAKLRLAEQQNSYAQVVRQTKSDIAQAQLRLQEQEKSDRTLIHTGNLAILRSKEQLKNTESEIATLKAEINQTNSQIDSARYKLQQHILKAPVKGIVFDLAIQKSGEVLQPGDAVAEIAPEGSPLVVTAQIATTESGFLTKGMPVKLKFDAYSFQDYGIVSGQLTKISPTSEITQTEGGTIANYNLEIELDSDCISTDRRCIALRPGDTVAAEVIIRQRRIIDFILDPFKKLQKGGLEL